MIAVDTNILVYAYRGGAPHHDRAWEVLGELTSSRSAWTVPWHCVSEFIAVTTSPKVFTSPFSPAEATEIVGDWLAAPGFTEIAEGPEHWAVYSRLLRSVQRVGPRVYDLRIAALCIEHGVRELWSADRDLAGVADLAIRNPLLDSTRDREPIR